MPGSSGWTSCIQVYCHMLLSPLVILTSPHSHLQNSTLHTHPSKYTTHSHSHTQHPATMVSKVLALTCMAGLAGMANARSLVSMCYCLHCCTEPTTSRVAARLLHSLWHCITPLISQYRELPAVLVHPDF